MASTSPVGGTTPVVFLGLAGRSRRDNHHLRNVEASPHASNSGRISPTCVDGCRMPRQFETLLPHALPLHWVVLPRHGRSCRCLLGELLLGSLGVRDTWQHDTQFCRGEAKDPAADYD
jgi:hypothetical protein